MKIAVLTSGGDAPGMNAAIRSVVRSAIYFGHSVCGIKNGLEGLIDGDIFDMEKSSVADIIQRGGTILGSARSERFLTEEGFQKALSMLEIFDIDALVILGGDGSLRAAQKLSEHIKVAAIPCSIDNDLNYTERTIGFHTAVNTATEAISKIRDTTESHGRANIVQVMGRNCGDIALYSGLAGGAESIVIPEYEIDIDEIAKKAIQGRVRGKRHHIIVMAEGCGSALDFAEEFSKLTDIQTRVTILGYIQRGGSPVIEDRILASEMGFLAIKALDEGREKIAMGKTCSMVTEFDLSKIFEYEKSFRDDLLDILKAISI